MPTTWHRLVTARDTLTLKGRVDDALARVVQWMNAHHLKLAPAKTEALYLTGRKRTKGFDLVVDGHPIEIRKEAKYLGVILDTAMSGNSHIRKMCADVQRVSLNLGRILPRTKGASEENRRLLASVAESKALYGAPVWGDLALRTAKNRAALRSTQRAVAIRVCRAHRTVSTEALLVLARLPPWDLLAGERRAMYIDDNFDLTAAREATICAWQEEWSRQVRPTEVPRGAWTKSLIPDIRKWMDRPGGELTYEATQVLTGHGQFQTYMVRIRKTGSDTCVLCDAGTTDDLEHAVLHCTALQEARDESPAHLRRFQVGELVDSMLGSVTAWREGIGYLNRIMRVKKQLEDARRQALVSQRAPSARQDGTQGGRKGGGSNGRASLVDFSSLGAPPPGEEF